MRKMWKFIFTILLLFVIVALVKAYFTPDLLGEAVDNILSYDLQANRVVPEDLNATQDGKKGKVEYPHLGFGFGRYPGIFVEEQGSRRLI